ncbi:hypothetical protein VP01_265g14 [Puccinia sorghi]|uniref:RNA polymerase II assembly factor Rtp1 C-terminal domain-containing protein n=1 Tax=Puccinia sorghi TaxID=27349 RepID=A0A0L6V4R5_9BASI|nr:hypothetical protein VP01_265g14 [Puccinia sorghi]
MEDIKKVIRQSNGQEEEPLTTLQTLSNELRKNYPLTTTTTTTTTPPPPLGTKDITKVQQLTQQLITTNTKELINILLPNDLIKKHSQHPRFAIHNAVLPKLLTPITQALIKLTHVPKERNWAEQHLTRLLDLTTPKTAFSSLLSLKPTPPSNNLLSQQLLRPSGLKALLQSILSADHYHDDDTQESATLKRFESLYHILSHPPSTVSDSLYWHTILNNLIQIIILPQENSTGEQKLKAPDQIRRASCFILSQITTRQPAVFKTHLSPLLHAAFHPSPKIVSTPAALEEEIVTAAQINHALELINQLIINSEPSHLFIDRLVVPILPQLISLILFLHRVRAEPKIRQAAHELVQIWIKLHPADTIANWLVRAIRELEAGRELNRHDPPTDQSSHSYQWARDPNGMPCIKNIPTSSTHSLDFALDPNVLIIWFQNLETRQFLGQVLSTWLEEVLLLRNRPGFIEAKMTLFRIQCSLKILDAFEIPQIVPEPRHFFPFILHALRLEPSPRTSHPPTKPQKQKESRQDQPLTLNSLKFLNLDCDSHHNPEKQVQDQLENDDDDDDDDLDLDHGVLVAGLSLLVALIEGHPEMDEDNTPGLKEISQLLDELLLSQSPLGGRMISDELYDLGIKSRLLLSVRKALSEVNQAVEQERAALEGQYRSGLALLKDDCLPLLESWAPHVVELLLGLVEEADSFVYLNAIKALSALAERFYLIVGPALANAFARPLLHPTREETESAALRDFDRSVRVGEAMLQVIQRAGTALPVYIDKLQPSLLLVLHSSLSTAAPLKPSALAILAACVEAAPGALGSTLSSLIEACLDILRCAGRPVEGSVSGCRTDKTTEENSSRPEQEEEGEPLPIVSPIYGVHHHWTLVRAALLFIQTLLSQTLALCFEAQSCPKNLALLATIRANIAHHLPHIHTVLSYLQLPPSSPVAPTTSNLLPSPNLPLPTPKSSPLVAASLLHNALKSLAVLRDVVSKREMGCKMRKK